MEPGQVGWILRFGAIRETVEHPGLVVHLPWPFESVRTEPAESVATREFGFQRDPAPERVEGFRNLGLSGEFVTSEVENAAEVMDGEESIVSVRFSVHYTVSDPRRFYFDTVDPHSEVQAFSESAVRVICATRDTNYILTGHRRELEKETMRRIQKELDAVGAGVRILRVTFLDVHAPPNVHYAFRDVASASEDMVRKKLEAESEYKQVVALAEGRAHEIESASEGYRDERVSRAAGRAGAFADRAAAFREAEELTRLRLYLTAMERILAPIGVILDLDGSIRVDLWLQRSGRPGASAGGAAGAAEGAAAGSGKRGEKKSGSSMLFPWEQ